MPCRLPSTLSPSQRPSGGLRPRRLRLDASAGLLAASVVILALALSAGCRGPRALPWRATLAPFFDGAWPLPFVPLPRAAWSRADETLFLQRIGYAEVVAVGGFRLVSRVTRDTRLLRIVLDFEADEVLLGGLEGGARLQRPLRLSLGPRWPGFAVLARGAAEPLEGRYLLLMRHGPKPSAAATRIAGWEASLWPPPPAAAPRRRFALYRAESSLLAYARAFYRSLKRRH
ncbi:MAG: hypothetical protein IPL40_05740 [Proteobacteria bacterium]|nr:hypothetical protein [Pseudomonadota bacterium]